MEGRAEKKGRLLQFQSADELALLGAVERLNELEAELSELEALMGEAQAELQQLEADKPRKRPWRETARVQAGLIGR